MQVVLLYTHRCIAPLNERTTILLYFKVCVCSVQLLCMAAWPQFYVQFYRFVIFIGMLYFYLLHVHKSKSKQGCSFVNILFNLLFIAWAFILHLIYVRLIIVIWFIFLLIQLFFGAVTQVLFEFCWVGLWENKLIRTCFIFSDYSCSTH